MFNSISGIIREKFQQHLYLDNNGIEWDINIPETTIDVLPRIGETVKVYTWLYHKEDSMRIFGFASINDRMLFLDLMKVNGVGPKAALKIMSSIPTNEFISILDSEDISKLEKLPGIGKKTAQKMMLALRGKLSMENSNSSTNTILAKNTGIWPNVVTALVAMGYDKKLCEEVIEKLNTELKSDESFINKNSAAKEDILFKRSIVELA